MPKETSIFGRLPAGLAAAAIEGGLGGLGSLASAPLSLANAGINYLAGENLNPLPERLPFFPRMQDIRQHVTEPLAEATIGKEYLEAQTFPEKVLQASARALPLAAATGGLSVPAIAADLAGSTAAVGAEEAGFGPVASFFAGIGGERGFTKLANRLSKAKRVPQNLSEFAKQAENNFYKQAEELGSRIQLPASKYKQRIEEIGDAVLRDKRLTSSQKKDMIDRITDLMGEVPGDKLPANRYVPTKAELNDLIRNVKDDTEKFYLQGARKAFTEEFNPARAQHKQWGKAVESAEAIHAARNFKTNFEDMISEYPKLKSALNSPLAYISASVGPALVLGKDPVAAAGLGIGAAAGAAGLKKAVEVAGFTSQPAARKVLIEAGEHLIKRNIPAARKAYLKVNKMAADYEKRQEKLTKKYDEIRNRQTKHLIKVS